MAKENPVVIYSNEEGKVSLNVLIENETVWLTQKLLAELFDVGIPAVNKHLKNIFEEGELQENSVISILETTHFRIWATDKL